MSDQKTPEQVEEERKEYYVRRLMSESNSPMVRQICEAFYRQVGTKDFFDEFVQTLEKSGRVGDRLYKSFFDFNLYASTSFHSGRIDEMPQNMPLAYAQMVFHEQFHFEGFRERQLEVFEDRDDTLNGVEPMSVDVPEIFGGQAAKGEESLDADEDDPNLGLLIEKPKK